MDLIKQISSAPHGLIPWVERLKNLYGFSDYYNIHEPCFFWGCGNQEEIINQHLGLKIVKCITPWDCTTINSLINSENLFIISDPFFDTHINFNFVNLEFEFQDYTMFKPKPLGNKIYTYMRDPFEFQLSHLHEIQRKINYEIIYGGLNVEIENRLSLKDLKERYYDESFLSINFSTRHGYNTIRELGYMGIKTITTSRYNFPSIIPLKHFRRYANTITFDMDEVVDIINLESKKIGTIQESLNPHNIKNEWIQIDFWKNKEYEKYKI